MKLQSVESSEAPAAAGGYSQALHLSEYSRLLFISGQIPVRIDGTVPDDFAAQCRLVWHHIEAQLKAADMTLANLVKVTTYLADRGNREENSRIRQEVLGDSNPSLTIIITGIYDEGWLLEIEAIAAA